VSGLTKRADQTYKNFLLMEWISKENGFMQWFLYLTGFCYIVYGGCAILYSFEVRQGLKLMADNADRRLLAALPALFGLLLAISAAWSEHSWFVRLIGLLALLKGALIFWDPENLWDKMIGWYTDRIDDRAHRAVGIIFIVLGTAMISWVR
jgi:uncharacterized protein YjeT (DUF2065 family)